MLRILNLPQFLQPYIKAGNDYRLVVRLQGHQGPINCICFSPDGRLLASGSDDGDEPRLPWQRQHTKLGESLGN
ncbi:hypothetical protein ARMGADRAFT_1088527 [Armillaria gallica]|uniref:Uncharacterized protein n=1 Tax=Armillaria gallica TaxID=47427 RepID=A0A2H3D7J9_ARMGA|nr:hypothetical protein ARMGADRAFT_1088527 [Armillaria gallica]